MEFDKKEFARLLALARGDRSINSYAREAGLTGAHISRLLRGLLDTPPTPQTIDKLARCAQNGVTYQDFMRAAGYLPESDKASRIREARELIREIENRKPPIAGTIGFDRARLIAVPVLGSIRGGPPSYAEEEMEGYGFVDPVIAGVSEGDQVFYLRVKGDSMEPKYLPGDLVLIRRQDSVGEGEVAAVLVGGEEATLKKVYHLGHEVLLCSTNPKYEPLKVPVSEVTIIGKALLRMG